MWRRGNDAISTEKKKKKNSIHVLCGIVTLHCIFHVGCSSAIITTRFFVFQQQDEEVAEVEDEDEEVEEVAEEKEKEETPTEEPSEEEPT